MINHSLTLTTRLNEVGICRLLGKLYDEQLELDAAKTNAVARARSLGIPWETIGSHLNMSRQAAWERWHHLDVDVLRLGVDPA